MVSQRAVEADIEGASSGIDGGAKLCQGQLRLARTGCASDAQLMRRDIQLASPVCESP
jgi:hypothetical protein